MLSGLGCLKDKSPFNESLSILSHCYTCNIVKCFLLLLFIFPPVVLFKALYLPS